MAITLQFVIEDGTGKADATSYASADNFRQYWINKGVTFTETDDTIKGWLNAGTEYVDSSYTFTGAVYSDDQALSWPRINVIDKFGDEIAYNVIPKQVIDAVCYLARQQKYSDLMANDSGVKSESYGPISKTYSISSTSVKYTPVDKLLSQFISTGSKLVRVN